MSDHAPAPSGLDPEARRARLFRSLLDLIRARARREPTLLWIEDLHWLDPASEAALEMLTEHLLAPESAGSRVLLLATTRPEYRPAWSSRVEDLSLAPLAPRDAPTLLDDWLGPDGIARAPALPDRGPGPRQPPLRRGDRSLARRARRPAWGARRLRSRPPRSRRSSLPETVQAVLASRIDRLADRDKDVLQAAAVIGRDVPIELLRAVIDLPGPALAASLERLSPPSSSHPPGLRLSTPSGTHSPRGRLPHPASGSPARNARRRRARPAHHPWPRGRDARGAPRPPLRRGRRAPRGGALARAGGPTRRPQ